MGNLVAIVGRPNVGKSTLFNRLTKSRQAIVSDEAGTTRDRQYGKCDWNGREFSVVDTGGWVVNSDDIFEEEIRKQVIIATEEADLVLFVCDIKNGVTDWDMDVAQILRRAKLPVLLVANKGKATVAANPVGDSITPNNAYDGTPTDGEIFVLPRTDGTRDVYVWDGEDFVPLNADIPADQVIVGKDD